MNNSLVTMSHSVFWSVLTIALYWFSKWLHRRTQAWWAAPLILAPLLLLAIAFMCHVTYRQYIGGTHWLVMLFGPTTVAFALPVYEQRALIRRYWFLLIVGAIVGSLTAIVSSWALSNLLGLNDVLRLSLLPRSMSTPFAMVVSNDIGGTPSLTAMFVLVTGILGATLGEGLLGWLPLRSALARGASFGIGAHAFGTAKAHEISHETGSVAGLVMVFGGLLNVLIAPLLANRLH